MSQTDKIKLTYSISQQQTKGNITPAVAAFLKELLNANDESLLKLTSDINSPDFPKSLNKLYKEKSKSSGISAEEQENKNRKLKRPSMGIETKGATPTPQEVPDDEMKAFQDAKAKREGNQKRMTHPPSLQQALAEAQQKYEAKNNENFNDKEEEENPTPTPNPNPNPNPNPSN